MRTSLPAVAVGAFRYGAPVRVDGTCLMCSGPSPEGPCCSTACLSAAVRERERNLRQLRLLRTVPGSEATCAQLTRRNGELTGALVTGLQAFRTTASPPASLA
jgi:hypothetical protein